MSLRYGFVLGMLVLCLLLAPVAGELSSPRRALSAVRQRTHTTAGNRRINNAGQHRGRSTPQISEVPGDLQESLSPPPSSPSQRAGSSVGDSPQPSEDILTAPLPSATVEQLQGGEVLGTERAVLSLEGPFQLQEGGISVKVSNEGEFVMHWELKEQPPWAVQTLGQWEGDLPKGESVNLEFKVNPTLQPPPEGEHKGKLIIISNGGQGQVPITLAQLLGTTARGVAQKPLDQGNVASAAAPEQAAASSPLEAKSTVNAPIESPAAPLPAVVPLLSPMAPSESPAVSEQAQSPEPFVETFPPSAPEASSVAPRGAPGAEAVSSAGSPDLGGESTPVAAPVAGPLIIAPLNVSSPGVVPVPSVMTPAPGVAPSLQTLTDVVAPGPLDAHEEAELLEQELQEEAMPSAGPSASELLEAELEANDAVVAAFPPAETPSEAPIPASQQEAGELLEQDLPAEDGASAPLPELAVGDGTVQEDAAPLPAHSEAQHSPASIPPVVVSLPGSHNVDKVPPAQAGSSGKQGPHAPGSGPQSPGSGPHAPGSTASAPSAEGGQKPTPDFAQSPAAEAVQGPAAEPEAETSLSGPSTGDGDPAAEDGPPKLQVERFPKEGGQVGHFQIILTNAGGSTLVVKLTGPNFVQIVPTTLDLGHNRSRNVSVKVDDAHPEARLGEINIQSNGGNQVLSIGQQSEIRNSSGTAQKSSVWLSLLSVGGLGIFVLMYYMKRDPSSGTSTAVETELTEQEKEPLQPSARAGDWQDEGWDDEEAGWNEGDDGDGWGSSPQISPRRISTAPARKPVALSKPKPKKSSRPSSPVEEPKSKPKPKPKKSSRPSSPVEEPKPKPKPKKSSRPSSPVEDCKPRPKPKKSSRPSSPVEEPKPKPKLKPRKSSRPSSPVEPTAFKSSSAAFPEGRATDLKLDLEDDDAAWDDDGWGATATIEPVKPFKSVSKAPARIPKTSVAAEPTSSRFGGFEEDWNDDENSGWGDVGWGGQLDIGSSPAKVDTSQKAAKDDDGWGDAGVAGVAGDWNDDDDWEDDGWGN